MTIKREKMFEKINKDLLVMSNIVFKQLKSVSDKIEGTHALNAETEIDQNESIIDSLETKIRKNVIASILLYTPRASDLRKIMACYDIAISIERIGDLLQNINRALSAIDEQGDLYCAINAKLRELMSATHLMVSNSMYSFINEDIVLTKATIKDDDIVDGIYYDISQEILKHSAGKSLSKKELADMVSLSSSAHNIERIADYATNIVEAAVYLIEGENIQHQPLEEE